MRAIAAGHAEAIAKDAWRRREGLFSAFIHWQGLDPELLFDVIRGWPAASLARVTKLLLQNPAHWKRGFPDLSLVDGQGRPHFIEVKSPSDKLRPEQEQWLDLLLAEGMEVRLDG